jgi:hypothetical protein
VDPDPDLCRQRWLKGGREEKGEISFVEELRYSLWSLEASPKAHRHLWMSNNK